MSICSVCGRENGKSKYVEHYCVKEPVKWRCHVCESEENVRRMASGKKWCVRCWNEYVRSS